MVMIMAGFLPVSGYPKPAVRRGNVIDYRLLPVSLHFALFFFNLKKNLPVFQARKNSSKIESNIQKPFKEFRKDKSLL